MTSLARPNAPTRRRSRRPVRRSSSPDARPAGPDRGSGRSPTRARREHRAAPATRRRDKRRRAPTGCRKQTLAPNSISPAASAALAASQLSPSCSAARHSNVGSPNGSAAARVSKRRVSVGNDRNRCAKPSSRFSGQPTCARCPDAFDQLRRRPRTGQLEQRERIPARLRHDAVAQPRVGRTRHDRIEENRRIAVVESAEPELGQAGPVAVVGCIACRDDEQDRLGQQAAGDEGNRLHRGAVEPLRVVHDAQHRTLVRDRGEELQHCQSHEVPIRAAGRH